MDKERTYICIDLKAYYASVECGHRGLDPLRTNLLVADPSRSDQTICLAVSPSLKASGVPARPRLFEAKRSIEQYEKRTGRKRRSFCMRGISASEAGTGEWHISHGQ